VRQLRLVGPDEAWPPPPPKRLTWRQRQLIAYLRTYGAKRTREVPTHVDPLGALRRLERLGLVVQGFDGRWRAR
jgi:hypothetical protein